MFTIYEHEPLHLFKNYENASIDYPNTKIYLDKSLSAFPEFELETTYQESLNIFKSVPSN